MKKFYLFLILFYCLSSVGQDLLINEVVTKNNSNFYADETPDWIELHNNSTESIDLTGYSLSDDPQNPQKWTFKNGTLASDSFLLILASGLSHDSLLNNIENTQEDLTSFGWDYADNADDIPGTSEVRYTAFENSIFGFENGEKIVAAEIYLGPNGDLGYSYAGVHVKFDNWNTIVDRSGYDKLRIKLYLEEGKQASLRFSQDGIEDWNNYNHLITGTGDTTWYDVPIIGDVAPLDLSVLKGLTIEAPTDQLDVSFEFVLFNIEFSSQGKEYFSTDFKLSSSGETAILTNPSNEQIDLVDVPSLEQDFSYGRSTNNEWVIFTTPTPEQINEGEIVNGFCSSQLEYSLSAGFYDNSQEVTITGASQIRYTTDGNDPISTSELYTGSLTIDSNIVIKAACFDGGTVPVQVFTNTYFIGYETDLPVWSISTNPDHFFSEETGIYVFGPEENYENKVPYYGANFWQDWERPIHVEFFEESGEKAFEVDAGIKIFGNFSRANPKKSMSMHFRSAYGYSKLEYPIYPDFPGIESFDELILRSSGGDESFLHFRDGFHALLAEDLAFETQKYRPSVLFINGEYGGIHNIREKSNEDYFEENYNIDKEDIDLINGIFKNIEGPTALEFNTFREQLTNDELTYEEIQEVLDIESFIDYNAFEVYIANYDWGTNNVKQWRQSSTSGKWRWFMFDTDYSTGLYGQDVTQAEHNSFKKTMDDSDSPSGWPANEHSTLLMKKLMAFPAFKEAFVNRYCDLINTKFVPQNVFDLLDDKVLSKIGGEVDLNRETWGLGLEEWHIYLEDYKNFWSIRPAYARSNMAEIIALDNEMSLTLNISPEGAGYIKLNTIEIDDANWSGVYFKGIPVNIEAIANPGYTFTDWNSTDLTLSSTTNSIINNLDLINDNTLTANFTGSAVEQLVTISEINYNSSDELDTKDWIELHNYGSEMVDISHWIIKDLKVYNTFEIPEGTTLQPDEYLVIAEDVNSFNAKYDNMNVIGSLGFGFGNSGERIYLYDNRGNLKQDLTYTDQAPWYTYADGEGGTLELLNSGDDVSDPENWTSLCFGGSPSLEFNDLCPLAIEDQLEAINYSLSPNPTSNYLHIDETIDIKHVDVYNVTGKNVIQSQESHNLDVSNLETGIYFLSITTTDIDKINLKFFKK